MVYKIENYMKAFALFFLSSALLATSCNKGDSTPSNAPVAKFAISGFEMAAPSTITFINFSSNATSYLWDFGDGITSTEFNPTHTYATNGSYLLRLKATGSAGENTACKIVAIEAPPPSNRSAFSYFQEKCQGTPVGISFKTINPLSTSPVWLISNGTTALDRDPIFQFLLPGDYTIKYSSLINGVRDTVTRIIRID